MPHGRSRSGGDLVEEGLLAEMTTRQAEPEGAPPGIGYGLGMMVSEGPAGPHFGHNGGAPGMNGVLHVCPVTGTVVAVLANLDPPSADRLAWFLDERMRVDRSRP